MKRAFFTFAALLLIPLAALTAVGDTRDRPNILFLFADDQRADTIAALGNPIIKTPNLDRLAHSGVAFNRAYMQGAFNGATCVPSRAMLLSGQNLFHIDEKLMRNETWPEAFAHAGYTTFVSGKWHNDDASLPRCFQIARSMFTGGMTDPMHAKLRDVVAGKVGEPRLSTKHACEVFADETIRFLKEHTGREKKDEARMTAEALRDVLGAVGTNDDGAAQSRKEHTGGPFFAYVPFDAPHDPHIVPPDFPITYDASQIPLPVSFLPQHPWDNGEMTVRDEQLLPWPRPPEQVRTMIAEYYRYISYLDSQIGRVLDALAESPYAKNTIVVFSADSGVARGSHGLIGKQNLYEFDSVRVPLIISGPGIAADQRTDAMCYLFDVLPTLGKICGVNGPKTSEGIDFSATLRDPEKPARSSMIFAYKDVQRAICDARWKLIRYPQVERTQLFDLQQDPNEATNLSGKPEFYSKICDLTTLLEKEMRSSGDTGSLLVANPKPAEWAPPGKGGKGQ